DVPVRVPDGDTTRVYARLVRRAAPSLDTGSNPWALRSERYTVRGKAMRGGGYSRGCGGVDQGYLADELVYGGEGSPSYYIYPNEGTGGRGRGSARLPRILFRLRYGRREG